MPLLGLGTCKQHFLAGKLGIGVCKLLIKFEDVSAEFELKPPSEKTAASEEIDDASAHDGDSGKRIRKWLLKLFGLYKDDLAGLLELLDHASENGIDFGETGAFLLKRHHLRLPFHELAAKNVALGSQSRLARLGPPQRGLFHPK